MRKVFLILFLIFSGGLSILAQSSGEIFGTVTDAKTRKPVPFASVFLANTMMGVATDANGVWRIKNVPYGKYDITFSSVGYNIRQFSEVISSIPVELNVELYEDIQYLKEVTIKGKKLDLKKWREEFIRTIMGQTPNSKACKILNLEKVELDYDEDTRVFTATCSDPIEIENSALGYKIYYLLVQFSVDYRSGITTVAGIPRFEELASAAETQVKKWQKNREKAYFGSITHFIRALLNHQLKDNKFDVYKYCGTSPVKVRVNADSLLSKDNRFELASNCLLEIIYKGQQISDIKLLDGFLTLYDNGYYEDQLRINLYGYYARTVSRASEILPLEFTPYPGTSP